MGDLDQSPFFDRRQLDYIRTLLYGDRQKLKPLNSDEQKFEANSVWLRRVNEELKGTMLEHVENCKDYVSIANSALFLVEAFKLSMLPEAVEILGYLTEEERGGDLHALMTILSKARAMPAAWAVSIMGDGAENRYAKPPPLASGLNLEAMAKFK